MNFLLLAIPPRGTGTGWLVTSQGRLGHFTTAGMMRPLPQSVKDDKEAAVRLIDYFLRTTTARAMSTTLKTASLVLRDSPNVYDPENRISSATGFTYTYDADGNRVQKTNNNTNPATGTLYWHMSPGIVAESDISGALQSEYVFFDGERVARKDFPGSAISYYFSDHLNTASVVTDATGTIKSESDYYPWGGELQFLNGDSNHYKFTGKERDAESGLDYFGARHYSNGLGRFMTPDWSSTPVAVPYADLSDPQSLNQYGYVRNLPTTRSDPDGHDGLWDFVRGVANAWASDNLMGAGRNDQGGAWYHAGQLFGDAGATIQGGAETLLSAGGEAAGGVLDATGVGIPVGVAVNTVSTIGLVHGSGTFSTAASHLFRDKVESSGGSSGGTGDKAGATKGSEQPANDLGRSSTTKQSGAQGQNTTTTVKDAAGSTTYKTTPGKTGGQSTIIVRKDASGKTIYVKQEARTGNRDFNKPPDHVHYKKPNDKEVK